jgi:hypothetical protein
MHQAKVIAAPPILATSILLLPVTALVIAVRAMLGSLLGISTAAFFGVSVMVLWGGVRPDVAITVVALSLNAMLFSIILLGSLSEETSS